MLYPFLRMNYSWFDTHPIFTFTFRTPMKSSLNIFRHTHSSRLIRHCFNIILPDTFITLIQHLFRMIFNKTKQLQKWPMFLTWQNMCFNKTNKSQYITHFRYDIHTYFYNFMSSICPGLFHVHISTWSSLPQTHSRHTHATHTTYPMSPCMYQDHLTTLH